MELDLAALPTMKQPLALPRWRAMWGNRKPFMWLCGGYGAGKTTFGVMEAYLNAIVRHPGYQGIVAAPTHKVLWQSWFKEWCEWFEPMSGLWTVSKSTDEGGEIRFTNGSVIFLRSTSVASNNEGINAAWMIFEEATREPRHESYRVLAARVRVSYPGRMSTVLLLGPPGTRSHWTAQEFGHGPGTHLINGKAITFDGDAWSWWNDDHCLVRSRTADNPFLNATYESGLRNSPGATLRWCAQYLDAEFGAMEGAVWPQFNRAIHVVKQATIESMGAWRAVITGTDWGYVHPGAMIPIGVDGARDAWALGEEVHSNKTVADVPGGWVPIARELNDSYGVTEYCCDPSLPGNIRTLSDGFRRTHPRVRVYPANNAVGEGVRRVGARLEAVGYDGRKRMETINGVIRPTRQPALWISDKCVQTIARIEGYQRKRVRGELTEAPTEIDDDPCDALRYGVMGIAV